MKKAFPFCRTGLWSAVLLVSGCFTALTADAHGIWFAQRSGEIALIYGEGGDDLDTVKRLPLIRHFSAYDMAGRALPSALRTQGKLAVADLGAAPALLAATLDNGIWTKTNDGRWHKKAKNEVSEVAHSSHNFKYAVHVLTPSATAVPPLPEQTLQLIPLSAIPQSRGEALRLRVLFHGKPYAGAKLIADFTGDPDGEPLTSDANGDAEVIVRNQGLNVIAAEIESEPQDDRLTDAVGHTATLSFRLRHADE